MGVLRKIRKLFVSPNPDNNTVDSLESDDEIHCLSDVDDAAESTYVKQVFNRACGCFLPPGGRCSECGAISCVKCHKHCGGTENPHPMGCGRPLCREHTHMLTLQSGQTVPFCRQCHGKAVRRQRWQIAGRLLRDSLVEEEGRND